MTIENIPKTKPIMKRKIPTKLLPRMVFCLAVVSAAWTPLVARPTPAKAGKPMMSGKMMAGCDQMMKRHQKMGKALEMQNIALAKQVHKMNRAPEKQKLDLMAGIVTQLTDQRTTREAEQAKMGEGMMGHMMQHMQMGPESMAQCPMMRGMGGMKKEMAGMTKNLDAPQGPPKGQK